MVLLRSEEATHRLDTVVLDKTGTITWGQPELTEVIALSGWAEDDLLRRDGPGRRPARPGAPPLDQ